MSLPVHEVLLVPASLGRINGMLAETEIIKRYAKALSDELDHCAIRHRVGESPRPWEFVVSMGLGWTLSKKDPLTNRSRVWISDARASSVATLLAETLSHWGGLYAGTEHKSCKPVARQDTDAHCHIEPFELNGPKAAVYAGRLEELGRDLGRTIADYVVREKSGAGIKVQTAADFPRAENVRKIY